MASTRSARGTSRSTGSSRRRPPGKRPKPSARLSRRPTAPAPSRSAAAHPTGRAPAISAVKPLRATFFAVGRVLRQHQAAPICAGANHARTLDDAGFGLVEQVCARLLAGEYDDDRPPARIHGDLWGGNVLYAARGVASTGAASIHAVLIDPAAHGGHGLTDLAMLALFGTEHLERVLASYALIAGLPSGWRELIGLHQLHPLLVHAVTHGPSYGRQAHKIAAEYA